MIVDMKRIFLKKGFTLIEVMVVVALIGILSAIIYANFNDARQDARNKALRSEIKAVQLALELYKAQNDEYPVLVNSLVPEFMADLPTSADSANPSCIIDYDSDGSSYKYAAINCFAGASNASEGIQSEDTMARCPISCSLPANGNTCGGIAPYNSDAVAFYETFAVYSVGAQCN